MYLRYSSSVAARQGRLEHVAGVDGAIGLAGADHRVQFVDEDDRPALVLRQFLEHVLEAFLELAAVLGAGQQHRHVKREHTLVLQRIGHLAGDDALRQALDDRRLADAGLADQHRVVLGTPLQHLDRAADLVVAADHGVELAQARALRQVDRVLLERLALAFGLGAVDLLAAANRLDRAFERLARQAVAAHSAAEVRLGIGQCEQEHLAGDVLVAALGGLLLGCLQQCDQVATRLHRLAAALDLGQAGDERVERRLQRRDAHARAFEQRARAVGLRQHRGEQVRGLDVGVAARDGQRLRLRQRFLEVAGQLVESHEVLRCRRTWVAMRRFQGGPRGRALRRRKPAFSRTKRARSPCRAPRRPARRRHAPTCGPRPSPIGRARPSPATRPRTPRTS
jgi:hypothetical protein